MAADPDLECHRVALEQNGVIARRQALALGLSPDSIYRRIQAGRWERLLPSVYRVAGFPDSWLQRLTAAALWVGDGGVVCGRAAGALWGLDGCPEGSIELLTTVKRSGVPASMSLRYSAHLAGRDTTAHKGLRVTTVTRTLLDLGSALASDRLEIVLEDALRKRMTAIPQLKIWSTEGAKAWPERRACARFSNGVNPPNAPPTRVSR
jgi:hypothetical protein